MRRAFAGGDVNFYRFLGNDPVNGTDPFGLCGPDTGPQAPANSNVCQNPGMVPVQSGGQNYYRPAADTPPAPENPYNNYRSSYGVIGNIVTYDPSYGQPSDRQVGNRLMFQPPFSMPPGAVNPNPILLPIGGRLPGSPLVPVATTVWTGNQAKIIGITASGGCNPTDSQFLDAMHWVDKMYSGNATAALGAIEPIRDSGTDNPLLASLDHYFNARGAVETSSVPGLMAVVALAANAGYCGWKALGLPVRQDSPFPPSPVTLQQWMAGNLGALQGLMPPEKSSK